LRGVPSWRGLFAFLDMENWSQEFEIKKLDDEQQLVFGFLSVSTDENGQLIIDSQGDYILPADLEKAAYQHVLFSRTAGEMHKRIGVGRLVESFIITKEKQRLLGIPDGVLPECAWWTGYRIDDPDVWKKIRSGEYAAFSIGGTGRRLADG